MLNKVNIIGRLGQDPEIRNLQNGSTTVTMSVATKEKWTDKEGKTQEKTEWHRVVAWGKLAEICSRNLSKGRMIFIEGKLQTRSWEDKGAKRFTTEIVAEKVLFLDEQKTIAKPHPQSGGGVAWPSDDESPF